MKKSMLIILLVVICVIIGIGVTMITSKSEGNDFSIKNANAVFLENDALHPFLVNFCDYFQTANELYHKAMKDNVSDFRQYEEFYTMSQIAKEAATMLEEIQDPCPQLAFYLAGEVVFADFKISKDKIETGTYSLENLGNYLDEGYDFLTNPKVDNVMLGE